jgi:phosphoglycolate phosphatase-like HAD superfamily hydrolase
MPDLRKVVIFDVDGVLIDSLPQHLQICLDKAKEFGLDLKIPSVDEFRRLVSQGMKVSPMRAFFSAVGFPEKDLDRAVADYEREFMQRYRPPQFDGAGAMLRSLHEAEWKIGLVTSNTRANVMPALADSMDVFDESCVFFHDSHTAPRPKSWYLSQGASNLGSDARSCIYIGDQPADAFAADEAGVRFLGVTYGWGITQLDTQFETVNAIRDIPIKLTEMRVRLLNGE